MPTLDQLEALAKAATPGPWIFAKDGSHIYQTAHITRDVWEIPHREADMPYIAAANPQTILALISQLRAANERIGELEERT